MFMTGLGLAALLAGCTSAQTNAPTASPATSTPSSAASAPAVSATSTTPASAAASATPTAETTKASAARTDPAAPKGQCKDSVLKLDLRENGGGLGSRQDLIVFRNTGPTSCTLAGAPGVSVVGDGDGTQFGKPAGRISGSGSGSAKAATLQPGESVTAELTRLYVDGKTTTFRTDNGLVACKPKHGDGYRVYPPHSYKAVFVKHDVWACTTALVWMHIAPVDAGK